MRLKVDICECAETGTLIDYLLVTEEGDIIARLGPEGATEKQKEGLLEDLGILGPFGGSQSSRVILEVES